MPVFTWKGLSAAGKAVGGTRDADSAKGLRLVLRRDGIFVTEHREMLAGGGAKGARPKATTAGGEAVPFFKREVDLGGLFQRVQPQEVAVFTRQLATLLRAGIPLAEALGALSEQSENKRFEVILTGVRQKVNEGSSLADTLAAHPKVFPELYTNMVRSGEAAGNLDAVLGRLADFLDSQQALRSKVSSAMTYPIIMMVLPGQDPVDLLMVVVVPKITSIFQDVGKSLPWNTNLLIFVSDTISGYWWLLFLVGGLGYWVLPARGPERPKGAAAVDRLRLRLPLIGPLVALRGRRALRAHAGDHAAARASWCWRRSRSSSAGAQQRRA